MNIQQNFLPRKIIHRKFNRVTSLELLPLKIRYLYRKFNVHLLNIELFRGDSSAGETNDNACH